MTKFQVRMSQTIIEECFVEVDAPDAKRAAELGREIALEGKVEWTFWESIGDIEVDDVMPTTGVV